MDAISNAFDKTSLTGGSSSGSGSSSSSTPAPASSTLLSGTKVGDSFKQNQQKYNAQQQESIAGGGLPSYDYTKEIAVFPKPNRLNANPFTPVVNIQVALAMGNAYLTTGKTIKGESVVMGNAGFVRSGTCDNVLSDEECKGKPRHMYINNIPSEHVPCSNPTQPVDPNDQGTFPKGLINGVVNDVVSLNPFEVLASANGTGSIVNNKCVLRTELTGYVAPNGVDTRKPETQCASPIKTLVCSTQGGDATGCVQLAPLPRMKPFNTIAMNILKATVSLSKTRYPIEKYGLNGNYPEVVGKGTNTFDAATLTNWQNTIVTTAENQLLMATQQYNKPQYANVQINSKGRCLISYAECTPKNFYEFRWIAFHEFTNMPQTARCKNASKATCNTTYGAYCDWLVGAPNKPTCAVKNPTIQVSWYAFYSPVYTPTKALVSPTTVSAVNFLPGQELPFGNALFYNYLSAVPFTTVNRAVSESFVDYNHRNNPPHGSPTTQPTHHKKRTFDFTSKRFVCVLVLVLVCVALCVALVSTGTRLMR